jgi:signal transduction histidine kinase
VVLSEITGLLEGNSYVSVPLRAQNRHVGRLFLVRAQQFSHSELLCLVQAASHAALLLDNVRLVDELTSTVASEERRRISRDLHDGAIQPYLGLKLGLEALRRVAGEGRLAQQLDELVAMAGDGIEELRRYVGALKVEPAAGEARSVLPAIRQQAEKFSRFYGIEAEVVADGDIEVTEAMCGEIVNIVREGLANIRRHTSAERATISLHAECGRLLLQFINDERTGRMNAEDFLPKSIAERARELGGRVNVYRLDGGLTAVAVEIPI